MVWAHMAAAGTGSLMFIGDVTHDGSRGMKSEVSKKKRFK